MRTQRATREHLTVRQLHRLWVLRCPRAVELDLLADGARVVASHAHGLHGKRRPSGRSVLLGHALDRCLDEVCSFLGVGDHHNVAGREFHHGRPHPLCKQALGVGRDHLVVLCHCAPRG
jgi:hypothetical protein